MSLPKRPPGFLTDPMFGRDLRAVYGTGDGRFENLDLDVEEAPAPLGLRRGVDSITGVDNAMQAVIHRIKTRMGELAPLGHPEYGSRHHDLIGQPNSAHNRNLVKLYILQALARDPRIEEVLSAKINFDPQRDRDTVNLELSLQLMGSPVPANLVVPFSFASAT